jgi:hypothetical protein
MDQLQGVIERLGGDAVLKMTLDRAWHMALAKEGGMFFVLSDLFRTVPTSESGAWLDSANRTQILQLTDVSTFQFRIGMSVGKMTGAQDGRIHPMGHLAHRLGQSDARDVSLTVFGNMDKSRYIKPYVVSWN